MSERRVLIAQCPEHGLHGERQECFVCGGPVEQVPVVPANLLGVAFAAGWHRGAWDADDSGVPGDAPATWEEWLAKVKRDGRMTTRGW